MVDPGSEIQPLLQILDLIPSFLVTLYVFLIARCLFSPEFSFQNVWKWVWYLRLACENSAYKSRSLNADRVDRSEICGVKATLHKGLDVELQVEPDTFEDHAWGHSGMQGLSRDVVLRVGVGRPAVEYQSLLVSILVGKGDFDMKLLLVEDFDLEGQEWLQ